ncbi:MAG: homoserine kinase [Pseudomonadota bacterium]
MAVYTHIDDTQLGTFLADYDVGILLSAKGIAEGVENTNYMVRTTGGTFILTLYEQRVATHDLPFFIGLMEHCAASGLAVPRPIRRKDGHQLGELVGRQAAMVSFLDGVAVRRPRPSHCLSVGNALAQFHQTAAPFSGHRDNALGPAAWAGLFDQSRSEAERVRPGLTDMVDEVLPQLSGAAAGGWPMELPQGVIHADLFPDNVFFIGDALSGLIDFYFACRDSLAYDLAILLNAWCFEDDGQFNVTKGRALVSGYTAVRALKPAEAQALPLLCRGAALRFLLTRLYDWVRVPAGALVTPKDPKPYAERLAFHMTVESASEYGLDVGQ